MHEEFKGRLNQKLDYGYLRNWINGENVPSQEANYKSVFCPYTGQVVAHVPLSGLDDLQQAVFSAEKALSPWRRTSAKERVRVFYRLKTLLVEQMEELTFLSALESGKTQHEAEFELLRAIESLEYVCSVPNLLSGPSLEMVRGIHGRTTREPVGITATVTPFTFSFMVPFWTIPMSLICGNVMIFKPSEQIPITAMRIAKLFAEAGLPHGVLNVIHGDKNIVEHICQHPMISAITFVGSTEAARHVYQQASLHEKRVIALGGAKNPIVVMPDAEETVTPKAVLDAAIACAGQRCMAASTVFCIGDNNRFIDDMVRYCESLRLGEDMGAIINADNLARIQQAISNAEKCGARLIYDGREQTLSGFEGGYWIGPTIMRGVTNSMTCANQEILGPVLAVHEVDSLEQAIELERSNVFGNSASIFTRSGAVAEYFSQEMDVGMVGVNIGVPVPREPFGFGGFKASKFGHGEINGPSSLCFWTNDKKISSRWLYH